MIEMVFRTLTHQLEITWENINKNIQIIHVYNFNKLEILPLQDVMVRYLKGLEVFIFQKLLPTTKDSAEKRKRHSKKFVTTATDELCSF